MQFVCTINNTRLYDGEASHSAATLSYLLQPEEMLLYNMLCTHKSQVCQSMRWCLSAALVHIQTNTAERCIYCPHIYTMLSGQVQVLQIDSKAVSQAQELPPDNTIDQLYPLFQFALLQESCRLMRVDNGHMFIGLSG